MNVWGVGCSRRHRMTYIEIYYRRSTGDKIIKNKKAIKRVIPCQLNQFLQKFPGVRLQYCPKNS